MKELLMQIDEMEQELDKVQEQAEYWLAEEHYDEANELCALRDELKVLMGATRFNVLMNDRFTLKAWRGEVSARYIAKHPWAAPEDCRPGWE